MKKTLKIFGLVTTGLIVLVIVLTIVLSNVGVVPYRVFIIHTGSMAPTIPPTSLVVVQTHEYHVGQVISFYKQGEVVTHRLVGVNSDGALTTKGDGNATADPTTTLRSNVIGGVIASPAWLGYWVVFFQNPAAIVALLLIILIIWWPLEDTEENGDDSSPVQAD